MTMGKQLKYVLLVVIIGGAAITFWLTRPQPEAAQAQAPSEISCRGWSTNTTTKNIYASDITYNVGIGNKSPAARLDVTGDTKVSGNLSVGGGITTSGEGGVTTKLFNTTYFKMPTSAGATKVLTSDAAGNGTWQSLPAPPVLPSPYGFGGMYQSGPYGRWTINPVTGASTCPAGFKDAKVSFADCDSNGCSEIHLCWK